MARHFTRKTVIPGHILRRGVEENEECLAIGPLFNESTEGLRESRLPGSATTPRRRQ
jgi:hypothetical protein